MTAVSNELLSKSMLHAGDIVMVRVGSPGSAAVIPPGLDRANCASVVIVRQHPEIDPDFLCAALNSRVARDQIATMSNGSAQVQINVSDAADIIVPVPPLAEQRQIAAQIEDDRRKISEATRDLDRQVGLLAEHRQALITAAVTGQLPNANAA
jgi:type I restriction enzyme S subunit